MTVIHGVESDRPRSGGPAAQGAVGSRADAAPDGSGIREIMELALARDGVVRLELGEPDFLCAPHIVEAGARACLEPVRYVQSAGLPALRQELARSLARRYAAPVDPERVIVTHGAAQGIALAFTVLLRPGDSVLVPDPAWPNYVQAARRLGAHPRPYRMRAEDGWLPDPDAIFADADDSTRVLVLNSPGNPTGAVVPRELIAEVVRRADARGITVVSDEVYDELIFEGDPAGAAFVHPDGVVAAFSFSKTYAMTGWRVGYLLVPARLVPSFVHAQEAALSCLSPVGQEAALAALRGPQDAVVRMREEYRARRDLVVELLAAADVRIDRPAGAFYAMLPIPPGIDARAAALELVEEGVAMAPGTAFGDAASDRLRISLASSRDMLQTGLERYLRWFQAK